MFTCTHVLKEGKPILYVSHDADGCWQFLCGGTHAMADAMVVGLKEMYNNDPSTGALAALPYGACAKRAAMNAPWNARHKE